MAAPREPAGYQERAVVHRGRRYPAPLRSPRRRRARTPGATDSPRGVRPACDDSQAGNGQMTGGMRLAWICCGLLLLLSAVTLGSLLVGAAPVSPGAVLDLVTGRGPSQGT